MKRRAYLAATGGAAVAGCLGGGSRDGLRLQTVNAPGSPGDEVVVAPDDRVALVDFFATWCAPCKPEMDHLNTVRDRYDESELWIVSITQERDEAGIREFWREYDGSWPVAMDTQSEAFAAYGVDGVPTIVVRTPEGEETLRYTGLAGTDRLVEAVDEAL